MRNLMTVVLLALLFPAACGDDATAPRDTTDTTRPGDTTDATDTDAPDTTDTGTPEVDIGNDTAPPDTSNDAAPTDTGNDTATPTAPNIATFLEVECPVRSNQLRASTPSGTALVKLTLDDPRAVCNDGSPAVAYARAATDNARAKRWVFHLQAGGGCGGYQDCRDRWCGEQGIYDAAKMSSRWAKPTIGEPGLFERVAANPPGQWNQVYVYYCSSDAWTGQAAIDLTSDTGEVYSLNARGHQIIEALLDHLDAGGAQSDDASVTLPTLVDAERILWTGSSAGSGGAMQHLDWVADRYPAANVAGVFDAAFRPDFAAFSDEVEAAAEAFLSANIQAFTIPANSFWDTSCRAAQPVDEPWRCAETREVLLNHMTTPFFQRMDLRDPTASRGLISLGATLPEWSTAMRDGLVALSNIKDTAVEKASITRAPGIYAPSCAQHIALMNDDWYAGSTLADGNSVELTFREALMSWLDGSDVALFDAVPATRSRCRTPTDEQ